MQQCTLDEENSAVETFFSQFCFNITLELQVCGDFYSFSVSYSVFVLHHLTTDVFHLLMSKSKNKGAVFLVI